MPAYFQQRCLWCLQFNRVPEPYARPAVACEQCGHQVGVTPVACACPSCASWREANPIAPAPAQSEALASVRGNVTSPVLARTAAQRSELSAEAVYWRTAQSAFDQARSGPSEAQGAAR